MFARLADRLLDWIWDGTEAIAGQCAVCAFWRGALAGVLLGVFGVFGPGWLFR